MLSRFGELKNSISISDSISLRQAKIFGPSLGISDLEFGYSKGWLENFKHRFNITSNTKHGEANAVDTEVVESGKKLITDKINKYSLEDVFNFDETALFNRLSPNKSLVSGPISGDKLS